MKPKPIKPRMGAQAAIQLRRLKAGVQSARSARVSSGDETGSFPPTWVSGLGIEALNLYYLYLYPHSYMVMFILVIWGWITFVDWRDWRRDA